MAARVAVLVRPNLRLYLLLSWIAGAAFLFLCVVLGIKHPFTWIVGVGGVAWERTWSSQVYSRAPTPREFFSSSSLLKPAALVCGFVLAIMAIWLLTIGQKHGRALEEYLPVIGVLILGPLAVGLAVHQIHVFRLMGKADV